MSNANFKSGDRVLVVKEYVIEFEAFGGYILNSPQESGTYEMRSHVQPLPPFKRGDVVQKKRRMEPSATCKVVACFYDEDGTALFVAEGRSIVYEADNYELFTPQNDEK